jgi:uncharacterized cupin superfamily protein
VSGKTCSISSGDGETIDIRTGDSAYFDETSKGKREALETVSNGLPGLQTRLKLSGSIPDDR